MNYRSFRFPNPKSILTQERYPGLWDAFQHLVGATQQKASLIRERIEPGDVVLEIGCSTGLVPAEMSLPENVKYIGTDVDKKAIESARSRRLGNSFQFHDGFASEMLKDQSFDLVVLSHMIHHIDDTALTNLLSEIIHSQPTCRVYVLEPEKKTSDYSILFRIFYRLEQGQYRREPERIARLLTEAGYEVWRQVPHAVRAKIALGLCTGKMWSFDARPTG